MFLCCFLVENLLSECCEHSSSINFEDTKLLRAGVLFVWSAPKKVCGCILFPHWKSGGCLPTSVSTVAGTSPLCHLNGLLTYDDAGPAIRGPGCASMALCLAFWPFQD